MIAGSATGKDKVTWLVNDFPPAHILSGQYAGQGLLDEQLRYLTERLTDFEHVIEATSVTRAWYELTHGQSICIAGALKTESRLKAALFSRATLVTFAPGLILRKDQLAQFSGLLDAAGAVDIDRLAHSEFKGIYQVSRSYGAKVDAMIAAPEANSRLQSVQLPRQAIQMLDSGRTDYTFGFPDDAPFMRVEFNLDHEMITLPIAGEPRYVFGYVACSDEPVGKHVVGQINAILGSATTQLPYFRKGLRWYDPKDRAELMSVTDWPR